jgi:hypothetical protein
MAWLKKEKTLDEENIANLASKYTFPEKPLYKDFSENGYVNWDEYFKIEKEKSYEFAKRIYSDNPECIKFLFIDTENFDLSILYNDIIIDAIIKSGVKHYILQDC